MLFADWRLPLPRWQDTPPGRGLCEKKGVRSVDDNYHPARLHTQIFYT